MSDHFEIPVGDPQDTNERTHPCGDCGEVVEDWYLADNNSSGLLRIYCGKCEERRSERYGCAMILAEGAMCQDGACGCGGTGVY